MYRSSTGNLGYYEEPPRGGERWDRDRFERMRGSKGPSSSRGGDEHDHYRFQERDRFPGGGRRDIDFHEDYDRRGNRVMERERFHEDERFGRPARSRTDLFDEPTASEVANRALAPYRRKSIVERDMELAPRRPARPQYIRRQSSLDTFDRRPMPRYGDVERIERIERDEWRPPANVPIPLPIRERRRSPPRRDFREEDFEDIRFSEREPRHEEYREVEVSRSKSTTRKHRSKSRASRSNAATSVRSSSSSSFEEVGPVRADWGKKGKTRLPKRLVKREAIIELGYPFDEEDDFLIVTRALEKEHIDEIIKVSENYKEQKTTYVYEDKKTEIIEAAPQPPPTAPPEFISLPPPPPPPASVHSHHTHHAHYPAPAPPPPPSIHYAQSVRSASPPRHEVFEERIEESNHIGGPLTVLVPDERRQVVRTEREVIRSDRDIKDEIRALEAERRMLKYERDSDYEIIERREPRREVVRVEKDRKVRREPNPKLVAAMMATLS